MLLLTELFVILSKSRRRRLGRPKEIKIHGENVHIFGFSQKVSEQIENAVYRILSEKDKERQDEEQPLTDTAVGLRHNNVKNMYEVITVKYNPLTKSAKVDSIVAAGDFKQLAITNFKYKILDLGFI